MDEISIYASEKQVMAFLKRHAYISHARHPFDSHFRCFIFSQISSYEIAKIVLNSLDFDAKERDPKSSGCTKAKVARDFFDGDHALFWRQPENISLVFASCRRTICACHETGSLAPRER